MHSKQYLLLLFVPLFFMVSCGSSSNSNSDTSDNIDNAISACSLINGKIANGEMCSTVLATSVVDLTIVRPSGSVGACSGVIIGENFVLTAAHCVTLTIADYLTVGPGADTLPLQNLFRVTITAGANSYSSIDIQRHPSYIREEDNDGLALFDLAIVKTGRKISAPKAPLFLSQAVQVGEQAIIAGYGELSPGEPSAVLSAGNAIVLNVSPLHLFISYSGNQSHPCRGDSGGPLYVRTQNDLVLTGIVSQSDPSVSADNICRPGDLTLYTNLQHPDISSFILSNTTGIIVR